MLESGMVLQQRRGIHAHMDNRRLHRLTNASSMHALGQVHEQTQDSAREHRPLLDTLAQVPNKTPLGMK